MTQPLLGPMLHKVASGRVFVRGVKGQAREYPAPAGLNERLTDAMLLIGVIEVPSYAEVERKHSVRLNSSLWLDIDNARTNEKSDHVGALDIQEMDIGGILTSLGFAVGGLPDSFEVFLRATMLPHETPGMRWAYIAAPVANRLEALPADGLYAFEKGTPGFRLVDANPYNGDPPSLILRKALWGRDGQFGMTTSMEPNHFPSWLEAERARNFASNYDPMFKAFAEVMEARAPMGMVHTASELASRDKLSGVVLREVMAAHEAAAAAAALTPPKPEPTPVRRNRP